MTAVRWGRGSLYCRLAGVPPVRSRSPGHRNIAAEESATSKPSALWEQRWRWSVGRAREKEKILFSLHHPSRWRAAPRSSSPGRKTRAADSPRAVMDDAIVIQHSWAPLGCQAAVSSDGHCSPVGWKSHLYPIEINEIYSN